MKKVLATLAIGLLASNMSHASGAEVSGPWSGFYDRTMLEKVAADVRPGILDNWQQVILPVLTKEERPRLEGVRFIIDIESPDTPLNFFAKHGEVYISASSVRMLGDLIASWIWLNKNGYSTDTVNEYLAILKYQWESGGLRLQRYQPLDALGVPLDVRTDSKIANEYAKVVSNALFFIISHELGHILYNHQSIVPKDGATSEKSILQEQQADSFALELMRRIGEIPVGVPLFFMFSSALEPAPDDPGYGKPQTHPQSSERIRAIATALRNHAPRFARGFKNPSVGVAKVNAIANFLVNNSVPVEPDVVSALESPVIKDMWRQKGLKGRLKDIRPRGKTDLATIRNTPRQNTGQLFDGRYKGKWVNQNGTDFDVQMELKRNGERVVGSWTFGPNRVVMDGTVSNNRLSFSWEWGQDYFGKGELYLQSDGHLAGTWGYTKKTSGGGIWLLTRPDL